jgi:hypothetical protein
MTAPFIAQIRMIYARPKREIAPGHPKNFKLHAVIRRWFPLKRVVSRGQSFGGEGHVS